MRAPRMAHEADAAVAVVRGGYLLELVYIEYHNK